MDLIRAIEQMFHLTRCQRSHTDAFASCLPYSRRPVADRKFVATPLQLVRRIGRRRGHAPQDPGEPVDPVFDLVAAVVVRVGIERRILREDYRRWKPYLRSKLCGLDWYVGLPVDGHHDGAIETVL